MPMLLMMPGVSGPVAPINPATLTELQAWYKTPLPGPPADGASLLTWADSSSHANTITFSGGAPSDTKYRLNIQNGNAVVNVTGNTRTGTTGAAINFAAAGGSMYWVGNPAFGSAGMIYSTDTATAWRWQGGPSGETGQDILFDAAAVHLTGSGVSVPAGWHIHHATLDLNFAQCGIDGTNGAPVNNAPLPIIWSTSTLTIPGNPGATTIWWGDIGEILLCAPELTPTKHAGMIAYLKARWAIA